MGFLIYMMPLYKLWRVTQTFQKVVAAVIEVLLQADNAIYVFVVLK